MVNVSFRTRIEGKKNPIFFGFRDSRRFFAYSISKNPLPLENLILAFLPLESSGKRNELWGQILIA
jgi:hypothetical protein